MSPVHNLPASSFKINFNFIFRSNLCPASTFRPSGYPTTMLHVIPLFSTRAICPVHLILLDLNILSVVWDEFNYQKPHYTGFFSLILLPPNVLNSLFSNAINSRSYHTVRNKFYFHANKQQTKLQLRISHSSGFRTPHCKLKILDRDAGSVPRT
jgi:hypothetical protein